MKDLSNENVIHVNKNGVQFLQFKKLLEFPSLINHAYSLGTDVNFRTSDMALKEKNIENYKKLCGTIGCNYLNLVKPNQKHTDRVQVVNTKFNQNAPDFEEQYKETDGLITNKSNIVLSSTNADCILLLFFDPVKKVIANTHSGWRGTLQRISIKTVEKMVNVYGCKPESIICCMCPSIRKCHFEVDTEVKNLFINEFKELTGFVEETSSNSKWHIDTILINRLILLNAGLKAENIIDSGICSVCNQDIVHSYRAEGKNYGLATALIGLK